MHMCTSIREAISAGVRHANVMSMNELAFQERGVSEACSGDIYFTGFPGNINCLSGEKLICMKYIIFPILMPARIACFASSLLKSYVSTETEAACVFTPFGLIKCHQVVMLVL